LKLEFNKGKHHLSLDLGSKKARDEYLFRKAVSANINNSTLQQALLVYDYKLNDQSIITAGSQLISRKIQSNDRGDHEVKAAGVFVLLNQKIGKDFQLNPALRVDWNERAGWEIVPQVNMSYRYEQFLFRGSAGRTTRDADFTERFNNYKRSPVPTGNRIGNPDLLAESSFSYELGADYFAGSDLKLSTTWFERFHTKLIDWIRTPYTDMPRKDNLVNTGVYNLAKNIDKVNTTGIETDIQYQKNIDEQHSINAGVGFVWMRSRSSDTIPSLYVSNHANELVNFNISYRHQLVSIGVNGLFKARRPQSVNPAIVPISKDYFLMNVRADANLVQNRLAVFVQVDNLFNRRYSDILGTVMPQRWAMTGIKLVLQ
jgi:iron complex outermembrane receptor protein